MNADRVEAAQRVRRVDAGVDSRGRSCVVSDDVPEVAVDESNPLISAPRASRA
jgi:hypothetical protein